MRTFEKILCPVDFSQASYEALKVAVELADADFTEICVLHVGPPSDSAASISQYISSIHNDADRRAHIVGNLCAVLLERVPSHLRTRPLLKEGVASQEIIRTAEEENADLIILTTHGGGAQCLNAFGSVASAVASNAPCSVLTINPFDHSSGPFCAGPKSVEQIHRRSA